MNMYGPKPWCWWGLQMRHRHGWFWHRSRFPGWAFHPWYRSSKESLREYRRWLEEEMKLVDEELKREEAQ